MKQIEPNLEEIIKALVSAKAQLELDHLMLQSQHKELQAAYEDLGARIEALEGGQNATDLSEGEVPTAEQNPIGTEHRHPQSTHNPHDGRQLALDGTDVPGERV